MRIEYLLFLLYLVFALWLVPKSSFVRHSGLKTGEARLLLTLKILCGIVCAFYFERISSNVDYLGYNVEGAAQYKLLLSNPLLFFTDFHDDIRNYGLGGLFDSKYSFWAYLRFNLLHKLVAVFNLVTAGNFYFNTIIFCTIVYYGHVAFYRIYSDIYRGHKIKLLLVCFFLPSVVLYTSCVHKDGVVFVCIGLLSLVMYKILKDRRSFNIKQAFFFIVSFVTIFLFRNYVCVALVPAILTALLAKAFPNKNKLVFIASYAFFSVLFFLSGYSSSSWNMPAAVIQRKADFSLLGEAKTNIAMNELYPTAISFIRNIPQAVNHYFLRPYLWEFASPSVLLTALELLLYQMIFLASLIFRKQNAGNSNTYTIYAAAFLINMVLIIGYTIPNIGAIVRYRSIFWVFLLAPLVCNTDWGRLFSFHRPAVRTKARSV